MNTSAALPDAPGAAPPDPSWTRAVNEHREALAAYLDSAASADPARWLRPLAPGKWTPGQVTEHLSLAYEAVLTQLEGGPPLAPRASGWRMKMLRLLLFPHILFHRSIPVRSSSPREIRPPAAESLQDRAPALDRLRQLGTVVEREMEVARAAGTSSLIHPYFGEIPLNGAIRFFGVHLDHHRRQIESQH